MTRLYQPGDLSTGICLTCERKVASKMVVRDFETSDVDGRDITVPGVLVAACTTCDLVVGIPHQSTGKINRYRKGGDDE